MSKKYLIALGLALAGSAAMAQVQNIVVSATVSAVCNVTANPLPFGTYNPMSSGNTDVSTTVAVACSKGSVPKIELGPGLNNDSGRRMKHSTANEFLTYSIFQPSGNTPGAACDYTTPWGTGTAALTTTAAPNINSRSYNVCGRLAGSQDVSTGSYSDTVAVTIAF